MKGALRSFDLAQENYADDVQDIVGICIDRYGPDEWKAVVLTHEIHGHLGIYSTLGAKMGTRAREIFQEMGCEGEISLVSHAGSTPPVSCLNDGLQVSTGATVGHGLIGIRGEEAPIVCAEFRCEGKQFTLRLKPAYDAAIRDDIKKGVAEFGHTPAYWQYVRRLALCYWRNWDRKVIFEADNSGASPD